jgi:hypothetical protein
LAAGFSATLRSLYAGNVPGASDELQRFRSGRVERACEQSCCVALLAEDGLDGTRGLGVAGGVRHALQLLVTADLEVLEGIRKRDELSRRIGVSLEERAPVQRAKPHRRVLQRRRVAAQLRKARLDDLGMLSRLREAVVEYRLQLAVLHEFRCALE